MSLIEGIIILETEEQWEEMKKRWALENDRPFRDIGIIGETKPDERGETKLVELSWPES
jgi:hypothetical protein